MKVKTLSALAGLGGALIMSSSATAAPQLVVVSQNTTNAFLVANGLQSAVIGVTGFAAGENLQGFLGTASNPWVVSTSGGGFFNVDSNGTYFDGQGQTAATALNAPPNGAWDSGVLANPTTNALGAITSGGASNPIGFAQFGVGANSGPGNDVFWLTLNPQGVAVVGTANLLRLTWSALQSATFSALLVTNTGGGQGGEHAVSITIPPVPAPGALALLGLAGAIGSRRRRA
jgi:hypothetical protein